MTFAPQWTLATAPDIAAPKALQLDGACCKLSLPVGNTRLADTAPGTRAMQG